MKEFLIWLILAFYSICAFASDEYLVIGTTYGKIRGKTVNASTGKEVDAWYSIPYAKKPLDSLRFRPSVSPDPWTDILDTTELPPACMQTRDNLFGDFVGAQMWNANTELSEDCLYINVVVPKPRPRNATVMVWIYGGGYASGSSALDIYDPKILVSEENIIFVSMQYRVNLFGFLYFGIDKAPGNAGLHDQLLALQWVQDNIAEFGGNPNAVTIFGESAGAGSTSHLTLSPLAKNLFKRSIMQSGSATAPWATIPHQKSIKRGLEVAKSVNCLVNPEQIEATVDCLTKVDAKLLAAAEGSVSLEGFVDFAFFPVIDNKLISKNPRELLEQGEYNDVDILLGANENEGTYFLIYGLQMAELLAKNVTIGRDDFLKTLSTSVKDDVSKEALIFEYTDWNNPNDGLSNFMMLEKLTGDHQFTCPVDYFAEYHARNKKNVFLYRYKHVNKFHHWPLWAGSMHADEIEFIFGHPLAKKQPYSEKQIEFSKQMMRYWTNFARTGNPNGNSPNNTDPVWPKHDYIDRAYINLNVDDFTISKGGLRAKQCTFFNKYLPKLLSLKDMDKSNVI